MGLSGQLPPQWGAIKSLKYITVSYNNLWGDLPSAYSMLNNLQHLSAKYNSITGSIPSEWGSSMSSLQELDLEYNYKISGSLPPSFANLQNLRLLHLSTNLMTGTLPPGLSKLGALKELLLDNNQFAGTIPASYGSGMKSLEKMSFFDNQELSGCLPWQWKDRVQFKDKNAQDFATNVLSSPGIRAATSIPEQSPWCSKK
jgi:Leucine-rich repeat (LRR) protein